MSDKRGGKKPEDITYPPQAHIRTPHVPGIPVEYPDNKRKQQPESGDKTKSLDWLVDADKYEAPNPSSKSAQAAQNKDEAKKPAPSGSSLDWLREADNYEPPKGNSKGDSKK